MTEYKKLKTVWVYLIDNSMGFEAKVARNFPLKGEMTLVPPDNPDPVLQLMFVYRGNPCRLPMPTPNRPRITDITVDKRTAEKTTLTLIKEGSDPHPQFDLRAEIFVSEANARAHHERRAEAARESGRPILVGADEKIQELMVRLRLARNALLTGAAPLLEADRIGPLGYLHNNGPGNTITCAEAEAYAAKVDELVAAIDALNMI